MVREETYILMEEVLHEALRKCNDESIDEKEKDKIYSRANDLANSYAHLIKTDSDDYARIERNEIEKEKMKTQIEVENIKQKLTWKRIVFEIAKGIIPMLLGIYAHGRFQQHATDFEVHGRQTSSVWKYLQPPRIFK